MNIFGEAISAFLSGVFRYLPGFSSDWPFLYCVNGCVAVVLLQIKKNMSMRTNQQGGFINGGHPATIVEYSCNGCGIYQ